MTSTPMLLPPGRELLLPPGRELLLPGFGVLLLPPGLGILLLPPGRELLLPGLGELFLLLFERDGLLERDVDVEERCPLLFLPRASSCGVANAPHINAIDTILQNLFMIVSFNDLFFL